MSCLFGCRAVFSFDISERGSVYYDSRTREKGYQPAFKTEVVDSSGAGDAFFSGTVMGLVRGRPLGEAVTYGTRAASWTLQVEENNCLEMAVKLLMLQAVIRHGSFPNHQPDPVKTANLANIRKAVLENGAGLGVVRASNTQPVLVARCEAKTPEKLRRICATVKEAPGSFPEVEEWEFPAGYGIIQPG